MVVVKVTSLLVIMLHYDYDGYHGKFCSLVWMAGMTMTAWSISTSRLHLYSDISCFPSIYH